MNDDDSHWTFAAVAHRQIKALNSGTGSTGHATDSTSLARWILAATEQGMRREEDAQLAQDPRYADEERDAYERYMLLGTRYGTGSGLARDSREAFGWYRAAAAGRDPNPHAQLLMGSSLLAGAGTETDDPLAFRILKEVADQGDDRARILVAACLAEGRGVVQDPREAARYLQLASDGDSRAGVTVRSRFIADCLRTGPPTAESSTARQSKDEPRFARPFRSAAQQAEAVKVARERDTRPDRPWIGEWISAVEDGRGEDPIVLKDGKLSGSSNASMVFHSYEEALRSADDPRIWPNLYSSYERLRRTQASSPRAMALCDLAKSSLLTQDEVDEIHVLARQVIRDEAAKRRAAEEAQHLADSAKGDQLVACGGKPDLSAVFDEFGDEVYEDWDVQGQWDYSRKLHGEEAALRMWPERRRSLQFEDDQPDHPLILKFQEIDREAERREASAGAIVDRWGNVVRTAAEMREQRRRHDERCSTAEEARRTWPDRFVELRRSMSPDRMTDEDQAWFREDSRRRRAEEEQRQEEEKVRRIKAQGRDEVLAILLLALLALAIIAPLWRALT